MSYHRIENLLRDNRLEEVEPDADTVVGWWQKAREGWGVYQTTELPQNVAVRIVYIAGFHLAAAVLQAEGYRTRSGAGGHHWATFQALRGLGHEKIDAIAVRIDEGRQLRQVAQYEHSGDVASDEMKKLVMSVEAFFPVARDYLIEILPGLEGRLDLP